MKPLNIVKDNFHSYIGCRFRKLYNSVNDSLFGAIVYEIVGIDPVYKEPIIRRVHTGHTLHYSYYLAEWLASAPKFAPRKPEDYPKEYERQFTVAWNWFTANCRILAYEEVV